LSKSETVQFDQNKRSFNVIGYNAEEIVWLL